MRLDARSEPPVSPPAALGVGVAFRDPDRHPQAPALVRGSLVRRNKRIAQHAAAPFSRWPATPSHRRSGDTIRASVSCCDHGPESVTETLVRLGAADGLTPKIAIGFWGALPVRVLAPAARGRPGIGVASASSRDSRSKGRCDPPFASQGTGTGSAERACARTSGSTSPRWNATATACALDWTPSFERMRWMCVATVFELMTSELAI
jgi:hypothetical protein